jgi:ubiquinone/menaquinone biosynthesis C-methylase UbiE
MEQAEIYARHAVEYDELVRAEDCDGNVIPAIEAVCPLAGAAVLEVGIGTARIGRAIVARVGQLVGVDRAPAMLEVARRNLKAVPDAAPWELLCADARQLPVPTASVDVAIAGWVFGHFREWMPEGWRRELTVALGEMRRAVRPGGALVIIETLGSGQLEAAPPTPGLAEYYAWLEADGFARVTIRTDYQFASVDEAARVTGFFFGAAFASRVRREGWTRIPEHTGLWWQRLGN